MNDAILIETYADMIGRRTPRQVFAFVTHNTSDFSQPTGNRKAPHPDLKPLFSRYSRYFVALGEALRSARPDHFADLLIEEEWPDQPRRRIAEIVAAERELFEKVWYNEQRLLREKVAQGQIEIVQGDAVLGPDKWLLPKQSWDAAERAAQAIEDRYGAEVLGPWNDFDRGLINGKLSALGWSLGDEWDLVG
jgi:hypothetical protein